MKRSDFYIKLTTVVLFIAIVCYIGFSAWGKLGTSFEVEAAIAVTIEDAGDAVGYIVREEMVVSGGGSRVSPVARDGEKVGAGHVIAIAQASTGAMRRAGELRAVKLKIEQLESLSSVGISSGVSLASGSVMELSKTMREGRIYGLDAALVRVESYVLTGASVLTAGDLPALREQLAALEVQSAGDATVKAPVSGVYSQIVDGYEGVRPGMLSGLTPAGLSELFAAPGVVPAENAGKLITGIRWYYAVALDAADTRRLPIGKQVQVRFKGEYQGVAEMTVDSVGRIEDGRCVVILSCASSIAGVSGARRIEAEIVYDTFTGIRVPKEAIHLGDSGETFVYLQTGAQVERVNVTILTEFGDNYLAVDAGTKPKLREGAMIIVKGNDLDNGKVARG